MKLGESRRSAAAAAAAIAARHFRPTALTDFAASSPLLLSAAFLGVLLAGCMAYCASGVALLRLRHGRRRRQAAPTGQQQAPTPTDGWCFGSAEDAGKQTETKPAGIPIQAVAVAGVPPAPLPPNAPSTQLLSVAPAPPPPPQQPAVRIFGSLDLTLADVRRLEAELVASRNRFVCLQLATMAREQHAAVQQARAAEDSHQLAAAARMHFATLEVGGQLVAGALFYPRDCSLKGGCHGSGSEGAAAAAAAGTLQLTCASGCRSPANDPHVYVELLVTNQPGRGWGSLLLAAIERHAAAHAATTLWAPMPPPRALKLLSVGSAQQFYRRCGYGEHREMAKPLAAVALPAGGAAA